MRWLRGWAREAGLGRERCAGPWRVTRPTRASRGGLVVVLLEPGHRQEVACGGAGGKLRRGRRGAVQIQRGSGGDGFPAARSEHGRLVAAAVELLASWRERER